MKVSKLAQNIIGSEIIKIATEVKQRIEQGHEVFNLTIGDFDPFLFPIPSKLRDLVIDAYRKNETNYPEASGELILRNAVSSLVENRGLKYTNKEIVIAAGARPIIYSIFKTLVDPEDYVLYVTPSWNNNHYTYLTTAQSIVVETKPENNFMPTVEDIRPHIDKVKLITLCSPQNPTGTCFTKKDLLEICQLVLEENQKRPENPVYVMYDQIYSELVYKDVIHFDPVKLLPAMKDYTIYVDGISKSLSATGVRVGWALGPEDIITKMRAILTHLGAWAPKPEQLATAQFITTTYYKLFLNDQRNNIYKRLIGLYHCIHDLKRQGLNVDIIQPQGGIYLSVKIEVAGKTPEEVRSMLLEKANIAVIPFYAFGCDKDCPWFRISVGTCKESDIPLIENSLRNFLKKFS